MLLTLVAILFFVTFPEDIPRNLNIVAEGRGALLESHPHDVIMLLKRFASDERLIQDRLSTRITVFGFEMFMLQKFRSVWNGSHDK